MCYSKNCKFKNNCVIGNIVVNTECQHSQNNAAGLKMQFIDHGHARRQSKVRKSCYLYYVNILLRPYDILFRY